MPELIGSVDRQRFGEQTGGLRVLLADESDTDCRAVENMLQQMGRPAVQCCAVHSLQEMRSLPMADYDVCLLEYHLGDGTAIDAMQELSLPSCIPVVLLTRSNMLAVDMAGMRFGAMAFMPKEELTAERLERTIRYAIHHFRLEQELERIAASDPLTGLYSRRMFDYQLEQTRQRALRTGQPLAVLLADLDLFKDINDHYGHACGDYALRVFARVLKGSVRAYDIIARYGGDEFAVILENVDRGSAVAVAEKIQRVLRAKMNYKKGEIPLHCSIGIAVGTDSDSLEQLLENADRALYRAKKAGRDTYFIHAA